MPEKTPDQIRRETVPVKHTGLIYGFLGGLLGTAVWFGGWGLLHQEQVKRYPEYFLCAAKVKLGNVSLFGAPSKRGAGLSTAQLRYALLRWGNLDHRYDDEILLHRWYPRSALRSGYAWIVANGAIAPVYAGEPAALVFKWPVTLTLLTFLTALIWGLVSDYRYRSSIIAGIPFDGSIVATVDEYNAEAKGDGMKYAVKAWKDR